MSGCHLCATNNDIARGVYKHAPWAEVPCSTCKVADKVGFTMEYDDERKPVAPALAAEDTSGELIPVGVMAEFVQRLLKLPSELRDVVAMRYAGVKYARIAEIQSVTMACVEKRHRQAMKLWPELRELFPVKASKQKRRKPHHKSVNQNGTGKKLAISPLKQGAAASRIRFGRRQH